MIKFNAISGRAVASFFISLVICAIIISILIFYKSSETAWYKYPANTALIIAGLLICLFFSLVVHYRTEIAKTKEYFKNMEVKDVLTSVYNRRYIDENIDRLIKSITRAHGIISLMIIDLDFFRKYNETYGHSKGDNCLKNVAKVLSQSVKRDNDVVARYGHEEFIIILPNTDEKGAAIIADRLLKNIRDFNIPHEKSEVADRMTISIGATSGGGNFSLVGDDYLKKAKEALALSKQNGRNRYTLLPL